MGFAPAALSPAADRSVVNNEKTEKMKNDLLIDLTVDKATTRTKT